MLCACVCACIKKKVENNPRYLSKIRERNIHSWAFYQFIKFRMRIA